MTKNLIYVSEEHIGLNTSPADARKVVDLLQAEGWVVVYGDHRWEFESDEQRDRFNEAFQWAVDVMRAEKAGADEDQLVALVKRRLQINGRLQQHETDLLAKRPRPDYWRWLLTASTDVILSWLVMEKEKGAPGK